MDEREENLARLRKKWRGEQVVGKNRSGTGSRSRTEPETKDAVDGDGIVAAVDDKPIKRRRRTVAKLRSGPASARPEKEQAEQDKAPQRTPKGRFRPGVSGNPAGRPPKMEAAREGRKAFEATVALDILAIRRGGWLDAMEIIEWPDIPPTPTELAQAITIAEPLIGQGRVALCVQLVPQEFCRVALRPLEVEPRGKGTVVEDGATAEAVERLADIPDEPRTGYWESGGPRVGIWVCVDDKTGELTRYDFRPARFKPDGHDDDWEWRRLDGGGEDVPPLLQRHDDGMLH